MSVPTATPYSPPAPATVLMIQAVLKNDEGGFVFSADPDHGDGGATYAGIIKPTWEGAGHVWPPNADQVVGFYYDQFYKPLHVAEVRPLVQQAYFSCGINVGPSAAVKTLQLACGLDADGQFGPLTAHAAGAVDLARFCDAWQLRYAKIVAGNPVKAMFLKGWTRRVNSYRPRP